MAGIVADPDSIAGLGTAFLGAAEQLGGDAADAQLTEAAFGRLPGSWATYQRYEQQRSAADADVKRLIAALRQFGDNLRSVAHNYAEADRASS